MKVLRIFDISAFVHAGKINKRSYLLPELRDEADAFKEYKIYTGGASLLWNTLYTEFGKDDLVFCGDRRPTIKQGMLTEYKANREFNTEIQKQKDACEYILRNCGFTVLCEDGYEGDDFIHSLVQEHKRSYDHIYIYCNDSDLYYLVDENVTVLPSSSRAKRVDIQNYTYTARGKDTYTPYNALTFYKILWGDTTDNIPSMNHELATRIRKAYDNETYYSYMGKKEVMLDMFNMFGKEAYDQCALVFPLDVRVPSTFEPGDKLRVAEWGSAIRNKLWRTNEAPPQYIKECIEEMTDLGLATDE